MATPSLAGHAVLARQYFLAGYYPSGGAVKSHAFEPSGALVKAVMIHGGQPLKYIVNDDLSDSATTWHDLVQGYGRAQLNESLHFGNSSLKPLTYFVIGAASSTSKHFRKLTSLQSHVYKLTVSAVKCDAVRVTLVWTDYPGTVGSSKILLNDLDVVLANSTHSFRSVVRANAGVSDAINSVEVILLQFPKLGGSYSVTVTAKSLVAQQAYALIISGNILGNNYTIPSEVVFSGRVGLTNKAKIAISMMTLVAFLLVACVYWIGFYSSKVKKLRKEASMRVGKGKSGRNLGSLPPGPAQKKAAAAGVGPKGGLSRANQPK